MDRYLNGFARMFPVLRRVKVMPIMLAHFGHHRQKRGEL
jgi:hypothetical protein